MFDRLKIGGTTNGDARSKTELACILAATLLVAAILLLFRSIPVGPIPAGDEFQYSMMSRQIPYAQDWIPNYIFYFVYSSTNYCGAQYYTCVKIINVLFLELTAVFVFMTARLFVGRLASFLIMLAFLASPFNVYASMFEPETMYAAAAWMLLYFYVSRGPDWTLRDSVAAGAGIAVLSMIKPHGVFFGAVFLAAIVFELAVARKSNLKVVAANAAAFVASFLLLRLPIGLFFAGTRGLNILGSGYTGIANKQSLVDYLHVLVVAAMPALKHVLAMSAIAGVPLCVLLVRAFRRSPDGAPATRLNSFTAIFFVVMIAVTSVFTATVGILYLDQTLDRLHTRYYNFFIFLFYLAVLAELMREVQPKLVAKVLASSVIMILALLSVFYLPDHFILGFVDNPEIRGLFWPKIDFYVFSFVNIMLVVLWVYNSRAAEKLFLLVQVPLAVALCLIQLTRDMGGMAVYQYQNLYPRAGHLARVIWERPLPEYFVAGPGVDAAWHTHFHIDKLGTRIELGPNDTLHRAAIPKGVTAGIIIGNNPTDFPYVTNYTDGSIRIIRIIEP